MNDPIQAAEDQADLFRKTLSEARSALLAVLSPKPRDEQNIRDFVQATIIEIDEVLES